MDIDDLGPVAVPDFGPSFAVEPMSGPKKQPKHKATDVPHRPLSPIHNRQQVSETGAEFCGLCSKHHAPGHCSMTESPENLAQYRLMLMQHAGDETIEERVRQ